MRILHLSTSDLQGGAAKGAFSLHSSLRRSGVDSLMLVGLKLSRDRFVFSLPEWSARLRFHLFSLLDKLPTVWYRKRKATIFSPGIFSALTRQTIEAFHPDIIHLHWISGGFFHPEMLGFSPIPIVWTMRDMWAFTGGCHLGDDNTCHRYQNSCGLCPHLGSRAGRDLSFLGWKRKERVYSHLQIAGVALSEWLAAAANRSSLFFEKNVRVIPNGIDTNAFRPIPRDQAREALDFSMEKTIFLFGCLGSRTNPNKGFHHLREAIDCLPENFPVDRCELVIFGNDPSPPPDLRMKVRLIGEVDSNSALSTLYSSADITIVPSRIESFGKIALESLTCGTPVLSFDTTGLKDLVSHKENGYRATCYDPAGLALGIQWILADKTRWKALSENARDTAVKKFSDDQISKKYIELYREILQKKEPR